MSKTLFAGALVLLLVTLLLGRREQAISKRYPQGVAPTVPLEIQSAQPLEFERMGEWR